MKIAIFAFLMVIVLTLVESHSREDGRRRSDGMYLPPIGRSNTQETDTVGGMRLKRDLKNKLAQGDLGNEQSRYIRDVNKKHHVHMSYERVPAARVPRNAQNLKNVHERAFAETEDAGK
jgi:hypothetical protein